MEVGVYENIPSKYACLRLPKTIDQKVVELILDFIGYKNARWSISLDQDGMSCGIEGVCGVVSGEGWIIKPLSGDCGPYSKAYAISSEDFKMNYRVYNG